MLILNQVSSSLVLPIRSLSLRKFALIQKMGEKAPESHRILTKITPFSISENPTIEVSGSYLQNVEILGLPEDKSRMHLYLFSLGMIVPTQRSQNVARGLILTEVKF